MSDLSRIVIGTWPLSGDYGPVSLPGINDVLTFAYEKGIREFDTAPAYGYGFMEFCLGKIFYRSRDVLVNTKVGNLPFGGKSFDLTVIRRSVEESLVRLKGLPINVLFLHNPRDEVKDYAPLIDYMQGLKKRGIIRASGLSKAKGYPYEKKVNLNDFDVIQADFNLLYLEPLYQQHSTNVVLMARSPLASGLLAGKIDVRTIFHPADHRLGWLKGERFESLMRRVCAIKNLAGNMDLASLAKRFVLGQHLIDKIIFGVKSKAHIDELIRDLQQPPLEDDLVKKLMDLYEKDFGLVSEGQYRY